MSDTFIPSFGSEKSIAVSGTSQSVGLQISAPQVYLYWGGTTACTVKWGKGTQTAVALAGVVLQPGSTQTMTKQDADTLAAINDGTAGTLYIICGTGT